MIESGYECADVRELNALLTRWLGELSEDTLAGDSGYKKNYVKVPIGGVLCGLSGDTTRAGVLDYLIAHDFGDPQFAVVAGKTGTVNKVVVGPGRQPIPGFYLYTVEPLDAPRRLVDVEWPSGPARSTASRTDRDTRPSAWAAPDLTTATAADLFALQGTLLAELRDRGILRTNNPPVGDYAEWLVAAAYGAALPANSNPSYDVVIEGFGKVQVKARVISSPEKAGQRQTSPFRSDGFDHAALVLLSDADYSVVSAALLPVEAVKERWTWRKHVNGHTLQMNGATLQHPGAVDITVELRRAAAEL